MYSSKSVKTTWLAIPRREFTFERFLESIKVKKNLVTILVVTSEQ